MKSFKAGFCLSDVLVSLSVLAIIASLEIPKLMQSYAAVAAHSKMLDAQSSIEQTWYNLKQQNTFVSGTYLGDNIVSSLNVQDSNPQDFAPLAQSPCQQYFGYVHYKDGTYITGLDSGNPLPADLSTVQNNAVLCIDVNGDSNPNQLGQDVFLGNFNPSGSFDGGITFPAGLNRKNFLWNATSSTIYNTNGAVAPPNTFPVGGSVGDTASTAVIARNIALDMGGTASSPITMAQLQALFANPQLYSQSTTIAFTCGFTCKQQLLMLMNNYSQIAAMQGDPNSLEYNDTRMAIGQVYNY